MVICSPALTGIELGRQMGHGTATPAAVRRRGRSGAGFATHSARTSPTPPRPTARGTGWILSAAAPSPAPAIDPRGMNTLVLRQVPVHHERRVNAIASSNRRSMNQEAILALAAGLPSEPPTQRPDVEISRHWLQRRSDPGLWRLRTLPVRSRSPSTWWSTTAPRWRCCCGSRSLMPCLSASARRHNRRWRPPPVRKSCATVACVQDLADAAAAAYALGYRLQVPLLFVGNDFSRTDLRAAL